MGIDLTNNCVAWWKFDNVVSGFGGVVDSSGNDHHGMVNLNSQSLVTGTGLIGNSIRLHDGQDITVPSDSDFDFTLGPGGGFSCLCWIKSAGMYEWEGDLNVATHALISRMAASDPGSTACPWMFFIGGPPFGGDGLCATITFESYNQLMLSGTPLDEAYFADEKWHCCILNVSRVGNTVTATTYIDGSQCVTGSATVGLTESLMATTADLCIGTLAGTSFDITAWLDSFAIFDRALTSDERTWLYNDGDGQESLSDIVAPKTIFQQGSGSSMFRKTLFQQGG